MHTKLSGALLAFLTATSLVSTASAARQPANSVLLRNVATLTLRKDHKTTNRRVSAIPQLKCIGGSAKGFYDIDVMRCENSGTAYNQDDIEWTCKASLPPEFKLGSTEVICEGYSNPDDPYILKGSCGVEYRLILTDQGQEKYGKKSWWDKGHDTMDDSHGYEGHRSPKTDTYIGMVFWLLFIGVLLWMVYRFISQWGTNGANPPGRRPGGTGGGGWGGWGGGDDNDPPPPYDYQPPRKPNTGTPGAQGFQPGFWSGALGGAAAGYMMGNRGQQNNTRNQGGGWFGGGGNDNGEGSSGFRRTSSGSSAPAPDTSRYESTGFGSTRRR